MTHILTHIWWAVYVPTHAMLFLYGQLYAHTYKSTSSYIRIRIYAWHICLHVYDKQSMCKLIQCYSHRDNGIRKRIYPFPHIYAYVYMHDTYTYTYMLSGVWSNSYNAILVWTMIYANVNVLFLIYTHTYICMTHILIRIWWAGYVQTHTRLFL